MSCLVCDGPDGEEHVSFAHFILYPEKHYLPVATDQFHVTRQSRPRQRRQALTAHLPLAAPKPPSERCEPGRLTGLPHVPHWEPGPVPTAIPNHNQTTMILAKDPGHSRLSMTPRLTALYNKITSFILKKDPSSLLSIQAREASILCSERQQEPRRATHHRLSFLGRLLHRPLAQRTPSSFAHF